MADYLLGIDYGTGGAKACITDQELNVLAYSFREYPIYTDAFDFSEHDANRYWQVACETIGDCVRKAGIPPREIRAIACSSAMPSVVMIDREGKPFPRAINLMDKRAKRQVRQVLEEVGAETYFRVTGNRLEDHPAAVNLMWLRENRPSDYARLGQVLSTDGFIAYQLTGVFNVNLSNAMFFGCFDIRTERFDQDMLARLGIDPALYPPVTHSEEIIGTVTRQAALETGLAEGTPVLSGQTDCNAGWLGAGMTEEGDIQMNLGTCGNFGLLQRSPAFLDSMINFHYTTRDTYIVLPTTTTGGVLMRYLRDNFSHLEKAAEALSGCDAYDLLNMEAEKVPPGSDGLVVLPYFMGERTPIWDTNAKGVVFGLSLMHGKGHLVRAMMESVAYALYHSFITLRPHIKKLNTPLVLNEGGAKSLLWRTIITDVFNLPTALVKNRVGAPYGDCLLAGVGAGVFKDYAIAREKTEYVGQLEPDPARHRIYADYFELYRGLYQSLKEDFVRLAELKEKYQKE